MGSKIGSSDEPVYVDVNGVPKKCGPKKLHNISIRKEGRQNGKVLFTMTIDGVTTEVRDDIDA